MRDRVVLITGASSGIGYHLAKVFSKEKYRLIIVGRKKATLEIARAGFLTEGALEVNTIVEDLSIPGAAERIYFAVREMGLIVDILVNDAGIGIHGPFSETYPEKELEIVQVNVIALMQLTKFFMKDMLNRNEGRILQVASIASYQPTPKLSVYAATKAFVLSLTDALIQEVKESNVTLTALIPGPTNTDFFRKADAEHTKAANGDKEDPAVVAKIGYEALLRGDHHAYAPSVWNQAVMSSVLPNERVASMAGKYMELENGKV